MDLMSFDAAVKNAAKQLTGKGKTIVCIAATKSTKGGHEFSVVVNGNITQIACCLMAVMTRHQHFAEAIKMAADGYKMVINLKTGVAMVKDFPQTGDITVKVTVKYTVDNTQVERVLQSTDEFFNDSASKYSVIGVLLRRGDPVFGYFDAVVAEDDEFCVRIRSSVNDRCCVLLPVDSIIGWFYL